uniref:Uncharacterized protein n=1 Tax=Arundo donax TaxID=35708 RepID=A0A0A9FS47_ARUDO
MYLCPMLPTLREWLFHSGVFRQDSVQQQRLDLYLILRCIWVRLDIGII